LSLSSPTPCGPAMNACRLAGMAKPETANNGKSGICNPIYCRLIIHHLKSGTTPDTCSFGQADFQIILKALFPSGKPNGILIL